MLKSNYIKYRSIRDFGAMPPTKVEAITGTSLSIDFNITSGY